MRRTFSLLTSPVRVLARSVRRAVGYLRFSSDDLQHNPTGDSSNVAGNIGANVIGGIGR